MSRPSFKKQLFEQFATDFGLTEEENVRAVAAGYAALDAFEADLRRRGRETLDRGPGQKQSGLGHTTYVAAQVSLSPQWALRAEVAKDSFKAFPEASGKTFSGGVVYNIGR